MFLLVSIRLFLNLFFILGKYYISIILFTIKYKLNIIDNLSNEYIIYNNKKISFKLLLFFLVILLKLLVFNYFYIIFIYI